MKKTECFKIRILECTEDIFDISKMATLHEINFDKPSFKPDPVIIVADPFLFCHKGYLYLFYELKTLYKPGLIMMIKTRDLLKWTDPVCVLQEKCHLSYPFVFEDNGHIYMLPETCGLNSIRLYEGNEDLSNFIYKATILKDDQRNIKDFSYSDSSIFKNNNIYYLMTSYRDLNGKNREELYFSENLLGPYNKHCCSPICVGNDYGRNGGSVISLDNKLFRIAQDCTVRYGDNIHILSIQKMNTTTYNEYLFKKNIIPLNIRYYKKGGHQFNTILYKGKRIVAVDAKEYRSYFCNKIVHKVKSLIRNKV